MEKVLICLLAFVLFFAPRGFCASQEELLSVTKQAQEKEEQLKKYKQQEARLSSELKRLTQKRREAESLRQKLSRDIKVSSTVRKGMEERKTLMEQNVPLWGSIIAAQTEIYMVENMLMPSYFSSSDIAAHLAYGYALRAQEQFLQTLSGEFSSLQKELEGYQEKINQLTQEQKEIENKRQEIQESYQKKQTDLTYTHRQYELARKDLDELKATAAQLNKVIKAAERKRKAAQRAAGKSGAPALDIARNSLMWPVNGKVISKFGKEYQEQLKTWIFRDGIKISARLDEPVKTVEDGVVVFAGQFRSYGNVVIVDHDGAFFTIYGFLNRIDVREQQTLHAGQSVGLAGKDTQGAAMGTGESGVYFEIRSGTSAVNPELWLQRR